MYKVGMKMATHLDKYVENRITTFEKKKFSKVLDTKESTIGRLLFYYPASNDKDSDWCGWHNDHSAITCLTPAIF